MRYGRRLKAKYYRKLAKLRKEEDEIPSVAESIKKIGRY